jgi:hypothetical protein
LAIIFIGTNKYFQYFKDYYESFEKFFLPETTKHFFVFTNVTSENLNLKNNISTIFTEHEKWPLPSLNRYKYIFSIAENLKNYDYILYVDADMKVADVITEDEFFNDINKKSLFAVQHPGFYNSKGTFETNPKSLACVNHDDDLSIYWQGCLWGGTTTEVLKMCKILSERAEIDLKNGIIAVWYDESHLNKYFVENKNLIGTLYPGYAYPENSGMSFIPKIIHLSKDNVSLHT